MSATEYWIRRRPVNFPFVCSLVHLFSPPCPLSPLLSAPLALPTSPVPAFVSCRAERATDRFTSLLLFFIAYSLSITFYYSVLHFPFALPASHFTLFRYSSPCVFPFPSHIFGYLFCCLPFACLPPLFSLFSTLSLLLLSFVPLSPFRFYFSPFFVRSLTHSCFCFFPNLAHVLPSCLPVCFLSLISNTVDVGFAICVIPLFPPFPPLMFSHYSRPTWLPTRHARRVVHSLTIVKL